MWEHFTRCRFILRLTDFGFARPIEYDENGDVVLSNTFCGSAAYAAPEIIQGKSYDPRKHDSWSLGVILYIMVCGSMPYDDSNVRKMLKEQLARKWVTMKVKSFE